jgi:uncharacterized coiled-coil protein SlyX
MNQYGMASGVSAVGATQGQYVPMNGAESAGQYNQIAGLPSVGIVRNALTYLDQTVDRLEKSLAVLYGKLQPVLYNGPETVGAKVYAQSTASPAPNNELSARILQIESRLAEISAAVAGMADRADI